jgi:AcrR family transcriptional regulator
MAEPELGSGRASPGASVRALFGRRDARSRILNSADRLFYGNGIRVTTIDQIVAESRVSKSIFYATYASKELLAIDYVKARHQLDVNKLTAMREAQMAPEKMLRVVLDEIVSDINRPSFHGCAFINAAAEFAAASDPVRVAVRTHREWYTQATTDLLRNAGHPLPGDAADDLLIVRDGGMSSYSADPTAAAAAMQRAIDRTLLQLPSR